MKKETLNNLIDRKKPTAQSIQKATEIYAKQQEEKESAQIIERLERIDNMMDSQIRTVRDVRAIEKREVAKLKKLAKAKEQYLQDADYDKFIKTYNSL